MSYRCPYCKKNLGDTLRPHCPRCGRIMVVPSMREPNERLMRKRKVENIWRDCERQKAELQSVVPSGVFHNPKFYVGTIAVLAVLGGLLFRASESSTDRLATVQYLRAMRHVDTLAEALGRYRFHTGMYPDASQGLLALVRDPHVPHWDGPYINQLASDPWRTPYVYEPSTNGLPPRVLSCGPDKVRGYSDDQKSDPARFDPGTEWTNGWVSAKERRPGITVLPSRAPASSKP